MIGLTLRGCCAALLGAFIGATALAEQPVWESFRVDWRAAPASPADLSFLLSKPAGKGGFIRTQDGHFVTGMGSRIRFWGVNVTMQAGLPSKEAAQIVAANLARVGVNAVRFHFLDRPAPTGIIAAGRDDTRTLDSGQLDRLDFLVFQLKERGIYSDLNLNVGRSYKAGDGVREHELLGFAKGLTYFDPRLIELQKEYARQLLTHRNPYTQREYRHEPAIALVEILNENSLVEAWFDGRLQGKNTTRDPGTWTDIPASYARDLSERFNRWVSTRFAAEKLSQWRKEAKAPEGGPLRRLQPNEFGRASKDRFEAEATFYVELERAYFADMRQFLQDDLKVESLLVGNSDHGHFRTGYPQLLGTAALDVVDGHVYWQHPHYLTDSKSGKTVGFDIPNTPMIAEPLQSTVVQLSRSAFAGKPYIISEVNHPFPNEYAAEGIPTLAAYAGLQDWDGVFWYTLGHRDVSNAEPKVAGHFDLAADPVKMAQLAAGALLFLRGDVRTAKTMVERSYSMEQVLESIRLPVAERPYFSPGFPLHLPLQHAVRIRSFEGPPLAAVAAALTDPIESDTQEIAWFHPADHQGLLVINTPRSQALVGFAAAGKHQTDNLALELGTAFAAVTLSALDDRPIARSDRLLLTACAQVGNSNMQWNTNRTSLIHWGTAPTVINPVEGWVALHNLEDAKQVRVQALDGGGAGIGPEWLVEKGASGWRVPIGQPVTVWYLLSIVR